MECDIAVVGGGLAGASFALAARGVSLALIDHERRGSRPPAAGFDARIYAISPGNAAFLRELGVWSALPAERLTPVHAMRVFGDDGVSRIEFDAYESGVAELAWIVEDGALQEALWHALGAAERLTLVAPAQCEALEISGVCVLLGLRDGRTLRARLVVGADGARSFVRQRAAIALEERAYGQTAVVANFACERAHRNVAYQWFQNGPVLALLPLPGAHVSMVWSTHEAAAARLLALDPDELCRDVAAAAGHALGELSLVTPPLAFALRRSDARRMVAPRVALLGDAAHVVHPLAGQGANLGIQDARALAQTLAGREPQRDPGELRLLRRYERERAEAILAMRATVHGLYRLFEAKGRLAARLRNAGLNLTDRAPVIKNILMRHAMM